MSSLKNAKRSPPSLKGKGNNKKGEKFPNTLEVCSFQAPLSLEACKCVGRPGNDACTNSLQKVLDGQLECDYIAEANFVEHVVQRIPGSDSQIMCNSDPKKSSFWRCVFIRCPEGGSTEESRQEGLQLLEKFFMDEKHIQCVPDDVDAVDLSNEDDPPALDEFFLDRDIRRFMELDIDMSFLNETFCEEHEEVAKKCWSHHTNSKFAHSLGHPLQMFYLSPDAQKVFHINCLFQWNIV